MALSQLPLNLHTDTSTYPYSHSLRYLLFRSRGCFLNIDFRIRKFETCCSHHTVRLGIDQREPIRVAIGTPKTKRKPRPSFFDQIQDKWSVKINSPREKLPWQEQEPIQYQQQHLETEEEKVVKNQQSSSGGHVPGAKIGVSQQVGVRDPVRYPLSTRFISAPWAHGTKPRKHRFDFEPDTSDFSSHDEENANGSRRLSYDNPINDGVEEAKGLGNETNSDGKFRGKMELSGGKRAVTGRGSNGVVCLREKELGDNEKFEEFEVSGEDYIESTELPWRERRPDIAERNSIWKRSKTKLAESTIPEHELRRLRNVALRMFERMKVGPAGITQALVDAIHEKWKIDEVVKLKFEEPLSLNMRKTHEILESKTRGLVIWRSGSSVVLYRGMMYKLPCVQSYTKQHQVDRSVVQHSSDLTGNAVQNVGVKDSAGTTELSGPDSARYLKDQSKEEVIQLCELDHFLNELGPRFKDWTGRDPLPVDADLLPPVVSGYKPPFRSLPYGIRPCLGNKEMTNLRRLARTVAPHFALGRNRELQGLAKAMVKLWERSAIAKIAIKRGVENTRNERMAEELKNLTGGILLSRNKDFIVFYRGNDFMPPAVTDALTERQKVREVQHDEEEQARQAAAALIVSNAKSSLIPHVAGTLAETKAAISRWGKQPSSEDLDKMMRDSAITKRASLVRYLKKKLDFAKGKLRKAEKALAKVQDHLEPAELPTDLETISDEERVLFRKIGLSMKPYLLLGRRGVYDGTIENMHLHWKHRELVKIIVKGKNFAQVKHIAISSEAESGGVLVSVDRTTKGYAILVYRGKNYQTPCQLRPKNLLTRRQALARSIELQRREALKHHIEDLQERIELLKSELEDTKAGKDIDVEKNLYSKLDDTNLYSKFIEEEGEEAYLETYDSGNEDGCENEESLVEKRAIF